MSERGWIQRYFAPLASTPGAAALTDDTAQLSTASGPIVITTDAMVEGVHFLAGDPVSSIARKLVRVNVSDILSGGAHPAEALLTLGWPPERPEGQLSEFAAALGEELRAWNISLIGGDTVSSLGGLFVSLTLTGNCAGEAPVRRGGGQPGDELWVTGELGGARRGFLARAKGEASPHVAVLLEPRLPPLATAELVARNAHAAMDISDGLLGDLASLAAASGCGALADLDLVPFADGAANLAEALDLSTWGDDYQLLLAVPPERREGLVNEAQYAGIALAFIGRLTTGSDLSVTFHGEAVNLPETLGFEHGRIGVSPTRP